MHSFILCRQPFAPWAQRSLSTAWLVAISLVLLLATSNVFAHAVAQGDKGYIQEITGVNILPFMYLGF